MDFFKWPIKKREKPLTMFASFWIKFTYLCLRQLQVYGRLFTSFIPGIWPFWGLVIVKINLTSVFWTVRTELTIREFCLPFAQTFDGDRSVRVNNKQPMMFFFLGFCTIYIFFTSSRARLAFEVQCFSHYKGPSSSYWYFFRVFFNQRWHKHRIFHKFKNSSTASYLLIGVA